MTVPNGSTYQAEILRHVHDAYRGELRDERIGVTRRLWNELGQKAGVHFASVSAALSALETAGCIATEFGVREIGGRARTAVIILEEPPEGETEYKERAQRSPERHPSLDPGRFPSAEEVAKELLALAVRAANLPLTDIEAARHHNECHREEIDSWVEVAEEADARANQLAKQLTDLLAEQADIDPTHDHELEAQLRQALGQRDVIAGQRDRALLEVDRLKVRESWLVERVEKLTRVFRKSRANFRLVHAAFHVQRENTEFANEQIRIADARIDACNAEIRLGNENNVALAEALRKTESDLQALKEQVATEKAKPVGQLKGLAGDAALLDQYLSALDAMYPGGGPTLRKKWSVG